MAQKSKLFTRNGLADHLAKARERESRTEVKKTGAISGLLVLLFGKLNNWFPFKDALSNHCLREFGELGTMIETAVLPEIPEVEDFTDEEYEEEANGPVGWPSWHFTKAISREV
jgi:hypothetical protein